MRYKNIKYMLLALNAVALTVGCTDKYYESKVTKHLEEKYQEKFISINYDRQDTSTEKDNKHYSIAYPEGKEDLVFEVVSNGSVLSTPKYTDTYLLSKLSKDLSTDLNKEVKEEFGENIVSNVSLNCDSFNYEESKDLSLNEFLDKYRDEIRLTLLVGIESADKPDKAKYNNLIFNIVNKVKEYNTGMFFVNVGFISNKEDSSVQEFLRTQHIYQRVWGDLDITNTELFINQLDNIESPSDLDSKYNELGIQYDGIRKEE